MGLKYAPIESGAQRAGWTSFSRCTRFALISCKARNQMSFWPLQELKGSNGSSEVSEAEEARVARGGPDGPPIPDAQGPLPHGACGVGGEMWRVVCRVHGVGSDVYSLPASVDSSGGFRNRNSETGRIPSEAGTT